jgi:hypothetical protein
MRSLLARRRLTAIVCLTLLLLAALTPASLALLVLTLPLILHAVVFAPFGYDCRSAYRPAFRTPTFSPRPPPSQLSLR